MSKYLLIICTFLFLSCGKKIENKFKDKIVVKEVPVEVLVEVEKEILVPVDYDNERTDEFLVYVDTHSPAENKIHGCSAISCTQWELMMRLWNAYNLKEVHLIDTLYRFYYTETNKFIAMESADGMCAILRPNECIQLVLRVNQETGEPVETLKTCAVLNQNTGELELGEI